MNNFMKNDSLYEEETNENEYIDNSNLYAIGMFLAQSNVLINNASTVSVSSYLDKK